MNTKEERFNMYDKENAKNNNAEAGMICPPGADDPKRSKFEEIAARRVTEACHKIQLIGNLANPSNYHYTEVHTKQMFKQLDEELVALKAKFMPKIKATKPVFSFKDEDEI
jgi:hypothetical protein